MDEEQDIPQGQPELAQTPQPIGAGIPSAPQGEQRERVVEEVGYGSGREEAALDTSRPTMVENGVSDSSRGRKITIEAVHYGFIVKVGCHTFALEQPETIGSKVAEYLADPAETEKKWFAGELFKKD